MIKKTSRNELRKKRHLRARKHVLGNESRPRLTVYRSNKAIYVQLIDDLNGNTLASTSSKKLGLTGVNTEVAKQVGLAIGKIALEKDIKTIVFDRSGYLYHGRIKALADSAREAGLQF